MAPNRETLVGSYSNSENKSHKPRRLSIENLQRTLSDISLELSKESRDHEELAPISEVEDAKCECCGMCEECTPAYIKRERDKFSGKMICGLCAAAVNQEMEKNGGKKEEALNEHMNACVRFNRYGKAYPVLSQAEAMREMFKRSASLRVKSISPRDRGGHRKGPARSSSCIPSITR